MCVGQVDHDLLIDLQIIYRSSRSLPDAVTCCPGSVWYRSNPGNMCQIMRIIRLPPWKHELDHTDHTDQAIDMSVLKDLLPVHPEVGNGRYVQCGGAVPCIVQHACRLSSIGALSAPSPDPALLILGCLFVCVADVLYRNRLSFSWGRPRVGNVSKMLVNPSFPAGRRLPGERATHPSPGGHLSTPPARRVGHWRLFFRRDHRGLMCGAGVARGCGYRGFGSAWESRCLAGRTITEYRML